MTAAASGIGFIVHQGLLPWAHLFQQLFSSPLGSIGSRCMLSSLLVMVPLLPAWLLYQKWTRLGRKVLEATKHSKEKLRREDRLHPTFTSSFSNKV